MEAFPEEDVSTFDPFDAPADAADPFDDAVQQDATDDDPTTPIAAAVQSVTGAIETSAFLSTEPGSPAAEPDDIRQVTLSYGGPAAGALSVIADASIGRLLVAAALGIDENDPSISDGVDDALCELVNVAAGMMMPKLVKADDEGNEPDCPLGLPELSKVDGSRWLAAISDTGTDGFGSHVPILVEGRPLLVGVRQAA
jgi:hypothetical protein